MLAIAMLAFVCALPVRADDVGDFLESHELDLLLALHLEAQMQDASSAEAREEIILRVAELYADLLQDQRDPELRTMLEERAKKLLEAAPPDAAEPLRLALLRGRYRTIETIAENYRLRLATDAEVADARTQLADISAQLTRIADDLGRQLETYDRRVARAAADESASLTQRAARIRGLQSNAQFLLGWSLYYQSLLNEGDRESARTAEQIFAVLLDPESPVTAPEQVSTDLRALEPVARSILGYALSKSRSTNSTAALMWLALLEHEDTFEALREQVPVWEIWIHLEHDEYGLARGLLEELVEERDQIPVGWLRLAAVHGLEDGAGNRDATALAQLAVTELASQEALEQILDLANRYGEAALGGGGFALEYVGGVLAYHEAREQHGSEAPAADDELRSTYQRAKERFAAALRESDASRYPAAAASARRLIAYCEYFASDFLNAQKHFAEASATLAGDEAAEAMWMAIISLDRVIALRPTPQLQAQLDALIDQFLERFPSSAYAPKLVLKRAIASAEPSRAQVAELLAVPQNSEVYDYAREQAAGSLYQLFARAQGREKIELASEYLTVAQPLLQAQRSTALAGDDHETAKRYLNGLRRVLDVSLAPGVERLIAAREALAAYDALRDAYVESGKGPTFATEIAQRADEITFRRIQERLFSDRPEEAGQLADSLWDADQNSRWSRLASRTMFQEAAEREHTEQLNRSDSTQSLQRIVRYGGRVLREYEDDPKALQQSVTVSVYLSVAEAARRLHERTQQTQFAEQAYFLYGKLLDAQPRNARFLRAVAELAEDFKDQQRALESWRVLVSGTSPESAQWYEAKFNLIRLLAKLDPPRAREVMDQHKLLHPEYGPAPWGGRLKGLDARIPSAPASAPEEESA